ncbi:hypothetical protein G7Y89_g12072 [Cudoniella acicularis]|uniref:NmrA-like domain-containing protein n=1 Tax=Cudoniella acicularis TaxID=354080 RepID=A0A8H4R9L1_9HELO|nr:hypothetical protein G7Y89_g12072 [Cudoniella acicularis]
MASSKKIIVVVGATGNQGSSVAHTFLNLPAWHVRCITRNPTSPASLALTALGAEVIQADLSDFPALCKAFSDATAIFVNTDFWESYVSSKKTVATTQENADLKISETAFEKEVLYGKNAARAAAGIPSLERFVYSALPPMKKHSKGKYDSTSHYESKASIVEYITNEQPELAKKASFIYLGAYSTNAMLSPKLDPVSERYKFVLPLAKDVKMPIVDPKNSTGPFVQALVEGEDAGKSLLAYDSYLTIGELVALWSKASGKEADYVEVSVEIMHQQFGIPKELLDAPGFISDFGYMGGVDGFIEPFQLKKQVKTKSFEDWMMQRDWEKVLDAMNSAGKPAFKSMEE